MSDSRILWLDVETTGLDLDTIEVLEIGLILTNSPDMGLEEIARYSTVIRPSDGTRTLIAMDQFVQTMHLDSGLWLDCVTEGAPSLEVATAGIVSWLDLWEIRPNTMAGGSGIDRYDLPLLRRVMPDLTSRLHFRSYDMSTTKWLLDTIGREDLIPRFAGIKHRALDDAEAALELCRSVTEHLTGSEDWR